MKSHPVSRRTFLHGAALTGAFVGMPNLLRAADAPAIAKSFDFPLVDLHVHLDNSSIEKVLELAPERGVKFGIVEHAGTKENKYPVVLSNDAELKTYLSLLANRPVYKGIQAEWTDWMGCFSPDVLAQLDYVLTDTMTFPGQNGQRVKLWEKGIEEKGVNLTDQEAFMDRYVDWHVQIMTREPIDVLANVSWLPSPLANDYDRFWTEPRMKKVFDAAVKYQVALEISSSFKLPKLAFLKMAQAAGVKFTLGSNGRFPNMGKLDYSLAMAQSLGLRRDQMFTPAPDGQKAVQRRKF